MVGGDSLGSVGGVPGVGEGAVQAGGLGGGRGGRCGASGGVEARWGMVGGGHRIELAAGSSRLRALELLLGGGLDGAVR